MSRRPSALQRVAGQAAWESRLLLRNGEQLLLTIIIPVALLLVLAWTTVLPQSSSPDALAASMATVLTVSVISSAFTSLAIATGFERRSGALRLLGTTPLSPAELLTGKAAATLVVTLVSSILVLGTGLALGWRPTTGLAWMLLGVVVGIAACAPWGLALAGLLRAEAVLAVANAIFLGLLLFGGIMIPAASLPAWMAAVVPYLPSGALVDLLTSALVSADVAIGPLLVLVAWSALGVLVSARTFRWT